MDDRRLQTWMLSISVLLALLATAAAAESPREPPKVNWERDIRVAWQDALKADRPLLVFVTMDSCLYCEKMKRTTLQDRQVLVDLQSQFVPVALNVKDAPDLVRLLNVKSFPTTVVIQTNGDVIESVTGYQTSQQFRQRLQATLRQAAQERDSVRRR